MHGVGARHAGELRAVGYLQLRKLHRQPADDEHRD
jgi:hypothetical protein